MAYTPYGPFTDNGSPGVSAEFLNPLENFLATINSAATAARLGTEVSEVSSVSAVEEHTSARGGRRIEAEVRCPAVASLGPVG